MLRASGSHLDPRCSLPSCAYLQVSHLYAFYLISSNDTGDEKSITANQALPLTLLPHLVMAPAAFQGKETKLKRGKVAASMITNTRIQAVTQDLPVPRLGATWHPCSPPGVQAGFPTSPSSGGLHRSSVAWGLQGIRGCTTKTLSHFSTKGPRNLLTEKGTVTTARPVLLGSVWDAVA